MTDDEFVANLVITLLTEDPSKIIEAIEDAEFMIAAGAGFDATRYELMAEYCLYILKRSNPHLPELETLITANEPAIEQRLFDHFRKMNW